LITSNKYCFDGKPYEPWKTTDGRDIDVDNSDEKISWEYIKPIGCVPDLIDSSKMVCKPSGGLGRASFGYYCHNPICKSLKTFNNVVLYQRADNSVYEEKTDQLKYVCGSGDSL
jgi:hypothetical protein